MSDEGIDRNAYMREYRARKREEAGKPSREEWLAARRLTAEQHKAKGRERTKRFAERHRTKLLTKRRNLTDEQREKKRLGWKDWYAKNYDRVLAYNRARNSTPMKSARDKVYYAVKTGKLTKPAHCTKCGAAASGRKLQAHHADYSKPLEVEWLCIPCHAVERRAALD
jgi:ribosomal protein S27AE